MFYLFVFNTLLSVKLEEEHKQDISETVCNTNDLRGPLGGKGYDIYQKASLSRIESLLRVCAHTCACVHIWKSARLPFEIT